MGSKAIKVKKTNIEAANKAAMEWLSTRKKVSDTDTLVLLARNSGLTYTYTAAWLAVATDTIVVPDVLTFTGSDRLIARRVKRLTLSAVAEPSLGLSVYSCIRKINIQLNGIAVENGQDVQGVVLWPQFNNVFVRMEMALDRGTAIVAGNNTGWEVQYTLTVEFYP